MNRIKKLRIALKKSQADIAEMLHVNRTTLTKWETGKHNPDVDTLITLADYFNVSIDYLLGKSNNPTPPGQAPKMPTLEEMILNDAELSEESKQIMLSHYKLVKRLEDAKARNEFSTELSPKLR